MARARNIKPAFFKDEDLADTCSRDARLLFAGLWTIADCEGRMEYKPRWIKSEVFPYDDDLSVSDIEVLIGELAAGGFIQVYEANEQLYIWVVNFRKHQNVHTKELIKGSYYPAPNGSNVVNITVPEKQKKAATGTKLAATGTELVGTGLGCVRGKTIENPVEVLNYEVLKDEVMTVGGQPTSLPSDTVDAQGSTTATKVTAKEIAFGSTVEKSSTPVTTNTRYDAELFNRKFDFEEYFEQVFIRHPNKSWRTQGRDALAEIISGKKITPEEFDRRHKLQCRTESWLWREGARVPPLFQWIRDRGYEYVESVISRSEVKEYPRQMM